MRERPVHTPVLLAEVLEDLAVRPDGLYVDCTLGEGGHAEGVLRAGGRVLGLEVDPEALDAARGRLAVFGERFTGVQSSFAKLGEAAEETGIERADGVLFDLGLSSRQIELSGRGFSLMRDEPLDMRFDPRGRRTAAELVNRLAGEDLARLFRRYGEEPRAAAIARAIARGRPLRSTADLVAAVTRVTGPRRGRKTHPATRVFQALRMKVNEELEALEQGLQRALDLLAPGGRLAVISYHSLEDRIVKQTMQREARVCICPPRLPQCVCGHQAVLSLPRRKAISPTAQEREANPRSRSARLRLAQRR